MKYLLRSLFGLLCLAAGAVTFLLIASPTDLLRDRLVEAVRAETGRELVIASGSMRMTPGLSIAFDGAALIDPADGNVAIVRMERLEVSVPVWQLIGRKVSVERLVMVRPVFELKTDAQGRRNWDFVRPLVRHGRLNEPGIRLATADAARKDGRLSDAARPRLELAAADPADPKARDLEPVYLAFAGLGLKEIRVVEGSVRLSDESTKTRREVTHVDMRVALAGPAEELSLEGRLKLDGEPLEVNASLASPRSVAAGRATPIAVRLASNLIEGRFDGKLGVTPGFQLAGKIEAKGASLRRLLALFGMEPPAADAYGVYAVTGELMSDGRRLGFAKSVIELDGAVVEGGLAIYFGDRRRLEADLTAGRVDLNRLLGLATEATKKPLATATTPADPKRKQEVRGWSNTAFDLSLLKGLDADIKLRARELIYLGYRLENARLATTLDRGVLKANIAEMQLYRGRGLGGLVLDATGDLARLAARFSFDGIDAQGLLRAAAGYDRLLGKAKLDIEVRSEGADQQALIGALSGKADLKVTEGAVVGIDLDKMLKGLRKGQFLGLSNTESEKTDFLELSASFAIDKGQARTADIRLISQPLRATGDGVIDLGRQQLDLNLKPKLITADSDSSADAGFEVPVRIQGPWDKPRYLVDAEAVLKNPANVKEGIRQIEKAIKDKNVDDAKKLLKGLIKR